MKSFLAGVCALAAGFVGHSAFGQERLVGLRVTSATTWDSNVYRLPNEAPDPQLAAGISGKSDRVMTTTAGLRVSAASSQQRFTFDANVTDTRYQKFKTLDRELRGYRGDWQWNLTPRLGGSIFFDRSESPVPFDYASGVQRIVVISTRQGANLALAVTGGWQLLGGVHHSERRYSSPFPQDPDSRQDGGEAGVRYSAPSGTSITVLGRSSRGRIDRDFGATPTFGMGDFSVRQAEIAASWVASGRSTVTGRFTRTVQRYAETPERDFAGWSGDVGHAWVVTGRLSVQSSLQRTLAPFAQGFGSSYRTDDTIAVAPVWQIAERVRLGLRAFRQDTRYQGSIGQTAEPERRDSVRGTGLTIDWSPHRAVSLGANLRREDRESTAPGLDFKATIFSLTAAFSI